MKSLITIALFAIVSQQVHAQSCFAEVTFDRNSVYVQQPFKVTITVMTATWFTAPLEFDNLQVPNAFVLPFDRNFPGMFDHNGKQYAGIQFHFIVFPYRAGQFTLPQITIHATTPPEGSSESRRIPIKTPARKFTVKPVPSDVKDGWFVAKSVTIHEHWNKSLARLKVGDVIERTVTVTARGTLPQFIPALKEGHLNFANVYPQDPELKDLRDENDANGQLTQSFTYLLEKEGHFTIPRLEVNWWNPNAHKMNKRGLREHKIVVAPNPDLGMLASIKDSLDVAGHKLPPAEAKKPMTLLRLPWYLIATYSLPVVFILYFLLRITLHIIRRLRLLFANYRKSELYDFRRLLRTSPSSAVFWRRLYTWFDRVDYKDKEHGLQRAFEKSGDSAGSQAVVNSNDARYQSGDIASKGNTASNANRVVRQRIKHLRQWILAKRDDRDQGIPDRQRSWSE